MNEFISKISNFCIKRIAELIGISLITISILLLISMMSYSPEDPNFIFPENTIIKNLMGSKGSYISDLFFQSFGLISILIPITYFFTGINILISKTFLIIIENTFFIIIYIFIGCLFFTVFHEKSFWLTINGNNGFLGNLFEGNFLVNAINANKEFSYYLLIILILLIFLKSINFKINLILNLLKKIFKIFSKKTREENNFDHLNIEKTMEPVVNETRIQENFSFKKENSTTSKMIKFKLPSVDFLKKPTKKERENSSDIKINEITLEKILLDFGVEGKIKKISNGPVVTLNEFEPAPGVKVSKIINLSEDIARNTSSESARIATIPGSSSVGIELPKSFRENVYLSEIISSKDFSKKNIKLPIALGKSISGLPVIGDLSSMPHLLIAGTTGSGKSVCINTIILSLFSKHTPEKGKFILIDPKM